MRFGNVVVVLPALLVAAAFACGDDPVKPHVSGTGGEGTSSSSSSSSGGALTDGAVPDPGDAAALDDGGLPATFKSFEINHVLSTGQSLSVGAVGTPPLSTTAPEHSLMFNSGAIAGGTGLTSFVPLVESGVETMSSALANHITANAATSFALTHTMLMSVHGVGGFSYAQLKKGTVPYANGMAQVAAGFDLAKAANKTYVVRAVTNVHGETDHNQASTTYQADITKWQSDYEADVKAITGQTEPIPMFHTQMSSWTKLNNADTSRIPLDQLAVHIASGGKSVLVGPKYHLAYAADGVHLTNEGYRHMGEDYAKVYREVVLRGKKWEPLRPSSITRAGKIITVKFLVPEPPLKIDDALVSNPADFGFELAGDDTPPNIESVDVTAPDTVTIKLTAEPTGANKRLRYAFTGAPGALGGPQTGPRGNLRDSDNTKSLYGHKLYNWCVHFDEALP